MAKARRTEELELSEEATAALERTFEDHLDEWDNAVPLDEALQVLGLRPDCDR